MEKRGNSNHHNHEHVSHHPAQQHHQHHTETHHPQYHMQESKKNKSKGIDNKIIENFVALQRVNTNLAEKFDKLTNQISNLLVLFETAARSFATSPTVQANEKDKEFLDKIDRLLDQNKTIAKGLTLMEERIRERVYGPTHVEPQKAEEVEPLESKMPEKTEVHPEDEFKPSIAGKPLPKF
jgi:uncharacterized protein (UPF0335 family)